jgi:hypothetical protein
VSARPPRLDLQAPVAQPARRLAGPAHVGAALRSPSQPLDQTLRQEMEPWLGRDLSAVRVHTDEQAAESARAVGAAAYTVGNDVVFGRGRFDPRSAAGRQLIAHELTHVALSDLSTLLPYMRNVWARQGAPHFEAPDPRTAVPL